MASLDRQTYKSSWNPNVIEMTIKSDNDSAGSASNAGTYAVDCTVPAGAYIVDIQVVGILTWNSDTNAFIVVGDSSDPNGYFESVSCKTTITTGVVASLNGYNGGVAGALYFDASGALGSYSSSARKVTASLVTTGTNTSAGETRILVIWAKPTDSVSSSYTAT